MKQLPWQYILLMTSLTTTFGFPPPTETKTECSPTIFGIRCPKDHAIKIAKAVFRNADSETCDGFTGNRTECLASDVTGILVDRCEHHQGCSIPVLMTVFGDPCPGALKLLAVDYQCLFMGGACRSQPCQHGGFCLDLGTWHHCQCSQGWKGRNCEKEDNDCLPNPCQNKGTCELTSGGGANCSCRRGFTGNLCDAIVPPTATRKLETTTTTTPPPRRRIIAPPPTTRTTDAPLWIDSSNGIPLVPNKRLIIPPDKSTIGRPAHNGTVGVGYERLGRVKGGQDYSGNNADRLGRIKDGIEVAPGKDDDTDAEDITMMTTLEWTVIGIAIVFGVLLIGGMVLGGVVLMNKRRAKGGGQVEQTTQVENRHPDDKVYKRQPDELWSENENFLHKQANHLDQTGTQTDSSTFGLKHAESQTDKKGKKKSNMDLAIEKLQRTSMTASKGSLERMSASDILIYAGSSDKGKKKGKPLTRKDSKHRSDKGKTTSDRRKSRGGSRTSLKGERRSKTKIRSQSRGGSRTSLKGERSSKTKIRRGSQSRGGSRTSLKGERRSSTKRRSQSLGNIRKSKSSTDKKRSSSTGAKRRSTTRSLSSTKRASKSGKSSPKKAGRKSIAKSSSKRSVSKSRSGSRRDSPDPRRKSLAKSSSKTRRKSSDGSKHRRNSSPGPSRASPRRSRSRNRRD